MEHAGDDLYRRAVSNPRKCGVLGEQIHRYPACHRRKKQNMKPHECDHSGAQFDCKAADTSSVKTLVTILVLFVTSALLETRCESHCLQFWRQTTINMPQDMAEQAWSGVSPEALVECNSDEPYLMELGSNWFYVDYRDVMRDTVDSRHPRAAHLRKFIGGAFYNALNLCSIFYESGAPMWSQEGIRVEGYVEYLLFHGLSEDLRPNEDPRISILTIRTAGIQIFQKVKSNDIKDYAGNDIDYAERAQKFRCTLNSCINALETAEVSMTDAQQQYFRHALLLYIKEWGDIE